MKYDAEKYQTSGNQSYLHDYDRQNPVTDSHLHHKDAKNQQIEHSHDMIKILSQRLSDHSAASKKLNYVYLFLKFIDIFDHTHLSNIASYCNKITSYNSHKLLKSLNKIYPTENNR